MLLATDVAARGLDKKVIIVIKFYYNNQMQIRKNILNYEFSNYLFAINYI